jgi:hypothetical protein
MKGIHTPNQLHFYVQGRNKKLKFILLDKSPNQIFKYLDVNLTIYVQLPTYNYQILVKDNLNTVIYHI